jgi:ABC-2 type transport system ATP-binding protein
MTMPGLAPVGDLSMVAAPHGAHGVQYRIVADTWPHSTATPVEPTVEDGYVALLRRQESVHIS